MSFNPFGGVIAAVVETAVGQQPAPESATLSNSASERSHFLISRCGLHIIAQYPSCSAVCCIRSDSNWTFANLHIQHAHPAKLTTDILSVFIGWYFLWSHHLLFALLTLFGASVLGTLLVWRQSVSQLYETRLGKWMIVQAEPVNVVVRSVGFAVVCYGFWSHNVLYFPIGIAVIVAARLLGKKARAAQRQ